MSKNTQANLSTELQESARSLKLRRRLQARTPTSSICNDAPMAGEIKQDVTYETAPNFRKPLEAWLPMMHSTKQEAHEAEIEAKRLLAKRIKELNVKTIAA